MRAERTDHVRRLVLSQAVAENLETIRGLPPRNLRAPLRRRWLRRMPFAVAALTVAASTYFVSLPAGPPRASATRASVVPAGGVVRSSRPDTTVGEPLQRLAPAALPLSVRRVVLDAGHGGKDVGATTPLLREKDITLDIGSRLGRMLREVGFEVVTTRAIDESIALRDRVRVANSSRSDIFVSIHVNSIINHTASHGVETYYLGPTDDPKLTELAAAENGASGYSLADMRNLLDGIYADARRDESRELATAVQQHLFVRLNSAHPGLENWGVKRAPFVVLVATDMPAVLAEVGCLSNEREATMLGKAEYRQKIAEALFDGIHAYAAANDGLQKKGT